MHKIIGIGALAAAICLPPGGATARVAPLTPEQQLMVERQNALEHAFRDRFSDQTFNRVRDMYGSVIVSQEKGGRPVQPRVVAKDEHGWFELHESGRRSLPPRIAHELNRLMVDGDTWRETPYDQDLRCARPQVFILRYAGNDRYGRQCSPSGLTGRLAQVAATLALPSGKGVTTAPPDPDRIGELESLTGHVGNRSREMVWAWERWSLAGAVDPYAEDVVVEFADGRVLKGKQALIDWMRPQQDWATPGLPFEGKTKGIQWHRSQINAPGPDGTIIEMREIRWEENGTPMRRTYSARWRNNGGLWEIGYERVSEDKLVTDERIAW